jgi:hypothetical protein
MDEVPVIVTPYLYVVASFICYHGGYWGFRLIF